MKNDINLNDKNVLSWKDDKSEVECLRKPLNYIVKKDNKAGKICVTKKLCSVDSCNNIAVVSGLCKKHRKQVKEYGNILSNIRDVIMTQ